MTQVVVTQPGQVHVNITSDPLMPRGTPRQWTTEWTDCFDDIPICLCTIFLPCYPCVLATEMNESCCVPCCIAESGTAMRSVVRARHNIVGTMMGDCVCTHFCPPCATCQLAREIKYIKNGRAIP